jgi:hypothetical protein
MMQASLFEPQAFEVAPLAMGHLRKAQALRRSAQVFKTRQCVSLARSNMAQAVEHEQEAEALAMYADFLRLAGVSS